jgi:hypothetical protein
MDCYVGALTGVIGPCTEVIGFVAVYPASTFSTDFVTFAQSSKSPCSCRGCPSVQLNLLQVLITFIQMGSILSL